MNIVEKRSTIYMFFPCTGGGRVWSIHTYLHAYIICVSLYIYIYICILFLLYKVDYIPYDFSLLG